MRWVTLSVSGIEKYENLYCFLVDFEIFDYWNNKDRYELGDYWRILISIDSTRYSLLAYASLSALSNEMAHYII